MIIKKSHLCIPDSGRYAQMIVNETIAEPKSSQASEFGRSCPLSRLTALDLTRVFQYASFVGETTKNYRNVQLSFDKVVVSKNLYNFQTCMQFIFYQI